MYFRLWLLTLLFMIAPLGNLWAFEAKSSAPAIPYEIITIDSKIEQERFFRGELTGDPHMFEFTLGQEQLLTVRVLQNNEAELLPLSLIIVKANDNNRGVAEVGRVSGKATSTWQEYQDSRLGFELRQGETFTATLGSGVYRMEVSTPENIGKYMLMVGGADNSQGYFASLGQVYSTQQFFGLSVFAIFLSSFVFYPLGIILLLTLAFLLWRYKKASRNA